MMSGRTHLGLPTFTFILGGGQRKLCCEVESICLHADGTDEQWPGSDTIQTGSVYTPFWHHSQCGRSQWQVLASISVSSGYNFQLRHTTLMQRFHITEKIQVGGPRAKGLKELTVSRHDSWNSHWVSALEILEMTSTKSFDHGRERFCDCNVALQHFVSFTGIKVIQSWFVGF